MKRRNLKIAICGLLALAALLSIFASGAVFAKSSSHSIKASGGVSVTAQKGASQNVTGHSFNMLKLPKEGVKAATSHTATPFRASPNLAAAKKNAAHNKNAPKGGAAMVDPTKKSSIFGFNGMADSATICPYFGGCQPPDMALATSSQFVFQGVNTSYELWTTGGTPVAGPVNAQVFFGVPNPSPAGCDTFGNGPFLSDPRAFYDPNTGYFWTAMLQVENALGIAPNCNFVSQYWIANFNPNTGAACSYHFDMALGTTNAADYTQFGFSGKTIAFTGNMFDQAGLAYQYAEAQFADKHTMEQCLPVTTTAFTNFTAGTVLLDTIQPVETVTTSANDPGVQYLVNSFNMNGDPFGHDCLFTACEGFVVWAYDPATHSIGGALTGTGIPTPIYVSRPNADQPGCFQCVETIDTRITATPVYSVGGGQPLISFSLDTGVNNGGAGFPNVVPGILWGQIQVSHGPGLLLANLAQSGYLYYSGDRATSFGAMMQDKNGRLFMVFDTMSANLNPSIMIASRSASDPLGTIGNVKFIIKGPSATFDSRWGDYEAASYSGFSTNHVWVASQYSVSGDWNTFIAKVS